MRKARRLLEWNPSRTTFDGEEERSRESILSANTSHATLFSLLSRRPYTVHRNQQPRTRVRHGLYDARPRLRLFFHGRRKRVAAGDPRPEYKPRDRRSCPVTRPDDRSMARSLADSARASEPVGTRRAPAGSLTRGARKLRDVIYRAIQMPMFAWRTVMKVSQKLNAILNLFEHCLFS